MSYRNDQIQPSIIAWFAPGIYLQLGATPLFVWTKVTGVKHYTAGATSLTLQDLCCNQYNTDQIEMI